METRLAADPGAVDALFDRAQLLVALGRGEEARQAFLDLLARDPAHFGGLNNLGALLHDGGYRTAARTVYARAAACHPGEPMAHVNLANALLLNGEGEAAEHAFQAALAADPDHPMAHQGLSRLLVQRGEEERAALHRRRGYTGHAVTELPYRGRGEPERLLLLMSAAEGNVPILPFLDDRRYLVTQVMADFADLDRPLPPHRRVINAIGDADRCGAALAAAERLLAATDKPVFNRPQAVRRTGRVENARRLAGLPGLRVPVAAEMARSDPPDTDLSEAGLREVGFPLLLRAPGFHTGRYVEKVDRAADLPAALARLPGDRVLALSYLDAAGTDGAYRKYRVMMVGGRLYPLHLAISPHWKVHYFSADMADRPDHRAEEAAFLADMPGVLGPTAMTALAAVRDRLGLDYGGIDFGLDAAGNVLLFEANATMVVPPVGPEPLWDYRRPAVDRLMAAIRDLIAGIGIGMRPGAGRTGAGDSYQRH